MTVSDGDQADDQAVMATVEGRAVRTVRDGERRWETVRDGERVRDDQADNKADDQAVMATVEAILTALPSTVVGADDKAVMATVEGRAVRNGTLEWQRVRGSERQ